MATISADGRTFLVNNKRIWITGAVVGYAGIPRQLWKPRLQRVASAGINTVVVPIPWAHHEPHKGKINLDHDEGPAAFCHAAAQLGLWVIPRVGPFIGERYSLGGLPSWITANIDDDATPRTNHNSFTAHASRWLSALCEQLAPLQATRAAEDTQVARDPRPGTAPVLAVQAEHHWYCGDDTLADQYFATIARYLREGGINVPILTLNNMFAHAEGAIEAWSGYANLHTVVRQLHGAWPDEPPIVGALDAAVTPVFGEHTPNHKSPRAVERALAEALAASGQFVISSFAPDAPRSFAPGQLTHTPGAFATAAPPRDFLAEDASAGPAYAPVRLLATFARSFARVFTAADPERQDATLAPGATAPAVINERTGERATGKPAATGVAIETVRGPAGAVVFLFADDTRKQKLPPIPITLPKGLQITADMGNRSTSWILLDTHLVADKRLDYATLPALAHTGRNLVLFGSTGARGTLSINGTTQHLKVPAGKTPTVHTVEGINIVLCNENQAAATLIHDSTVYVGAAAIDHDGNPIPEPGFRTITSIDQAGKTSSTNHKPEQATKPKLTLSDFAAADTSSLTAGTSDRFARIDGPAPTEALGTPDGYAWYRARFKHKSAAKRKAAAFGATDRVHIFLDDAKPKVLGDGPGAQPRVIQLPLKSKDHTLVVLADNMGRPVSGFEMTTPKGLWDHIYEVAPLKCTTAVEALGPVDLLEHRSPIEGVHRGDTTHPNHIVWNFTHRKKTPIFLRMDDADWTGLVILNGEPIASFTPGTPVSLKLDHEQLNRGKNTLSLAVMGDDDEAEDAYTNLKKLTALYEGTTNITENAEWAFAGWQPPHEDDFSPIAKSALAGTQAKALKGKPVWWRCAFPAVEDPAANTLRLECKGLSKGHAFLNGEPVARYWVATHDAKPVPPETDIWLPPDLLNTDEPNQLLIFDEHGFPPAKIAIKAGPLASP